MSDSKVKVYLIVEFEPLRAGLETTIPGGRDLSVCGAAASFEEAGRSPGFLDADVILVDVDSLDPATTQSLFAEVAERFPGLKLLFLGEMQDAMEIPFETLQTLLRLDTFGFVYKSGPTHRIQEAIKLAATRGFVCESDAIKHMLSRLFLWASQTTNGVFDQLSERELEVLSRVAQGKLNKEIARELFVSEGTVKAHVSHIMSKLNVERRTELVKHAITSGMVITPDEE